MNSRDSIVVGLVVTTFGFVLNEIFKGQTTFVWAIGGFLVVALLYSAYQYSRGFPFKKYYFEQDSSETGDRLISRRENIPEYRWKLIGKHPKMEYQFQTDIDKWAVFGPYLRQPLKKGKYRATFRVKVDQLPNQNPPIVRINVASNNARRGDKSLADRLLTGSDFKEPNKFHDFSLDFQVVGQERELELRVGAKSGKHTVTVESVELSQRLL